ncbi:MAG: 2-isopropylmalate synthase [Gammaproteobacteria bacterium]|nr:2-isopropylmalate synthase [Gammaproteobacteria bacterium]
MQSREIKIVDVTLRDGEQTQGVSFSQAEKVTIAKALLSTLQVDRIEVASAKISQGEREAVSRITKWAADQGCLERVEVLGFTDHKSSVDWINSAGGKVLNLLTKGSEKHCREQLRMSVKEHLVGVEKTIEYAQDAGLDVNVYLEDWSNGYADNRDYVFEMMDALKDMPIVHIMLPDTLGVMTPKDVYSSISDMMSSYPDCRFDFHPHNDYGLSTANAMAAVEAGVASIHCTINCLGERAGNASLAEVCTVLRDKMDVDLNIQEKDFYTISQMIENFSGKRVAENAPIVGSNVFTQTAGIHADGDQKGKLYQTCLSPDRFNRSTSYALGKMSGKASLQKNLEILGISLSEKHQVKVLDKIVSLGDSKTDITVEDLPLIIADALESGGHRYLELMNCTITSGLELNSIVSLQARLYENTYKSTGSGNGGFDAFINAIREIVDRTEIVFPELIDYQIRIPKGGTTSALVECIITWETQGQRYRTRGVDANQVFAGIKAAIRMLNMQFRALEKTVVDQSSLPGETLRDQDGV